MSSFRLHCGTFSSDIIREKLRNPVLLPVLRTPERIYRQAAVLVPLFCENGNWQVLFTRRTDLVHDHKGQVAFPGGASEPLDLDLETTALRETFEEIGIPGHEVCVLGRMPEFFTISGFTVTPVVGIIPWPYDMRLSHEEVGRVFSVPLEWLSRPENRDEKPVELPGGRKEILTYYRPYEGEVVWGATARITVNFLKILGLIENHF